MVNQRRQKIRKVVTTSFLRLIAILTLKPYEVLGVVTTSLLRLHAIGTILDIVLEISRNYLISEAPCNKRETREDNSRRS